MRTPYFVFLSEQCKYTNTFLKNKIICYFFA